MKNLTLMIKPASSLCNLQCRYCFYGDVSRRREQPSFGVMGREAMTRMLENIRRDLTPGDSVTFGFQGGEPTLAGLPFFRDFAAQVRDWDGGIRVNWSLQTNGVLLDEDWCGFLAENRFLVGLSLDLPPEQHDSARVDDQGRGTFRLAAAAMERLKAHRIDFNILCTLTSAAARHPEKVWKQLRALGVEYVQFTPCLDGLDEAGSKYALRPERFASFYRRLFRLWEADFRAGRYVSVKLFDDIVNLLAYGLPTACGMDGVCRPQLVVEADGSVYPCDFYCLDAWQAGNLAKSSLREVYSSPQFPRFAQRPRETPALCESCPYGGFCGGGCPRAEKSVFCAPGDTFCGYQAFLRETMPAFQAIAREQRLRRGI